ncbi:MAG: class II aldolase/adducin family protein, partial [Candidatus Puniceispirillales bacterium]
MMFHTHWVDGDANAYIERHAQKGINAELALRVYTSQLIGSDPDLVMHGGGNTSCKTTMPDLFGNDTRVLCVKGSGWDLATIEAPGLPAVRLDPLLELRQLDALSDEDMVNVQRANLMDQASPNPSVETLLHAFLPHHVVDHTHATPFLALANLPEPEPIMREIFGDSMAIVPYVMPGFALAKLAAEIVEQHPEAEGLLLLQHGHFTWGEDAKQSYDRVIDHTNRVEAWFADRRDAVQYPGTGLPQAEAQRLIHDLKRALVEVSSSPSPSFVLD